MINRALHSISNRAGGFIEKFFPDNPSFHPSSETPDTLALRRLLGVDRAGDDYHLVAVLAAIEAYPEIQQQFDDRQRTYRLETYAKPAPQVGGGVFVPDAAGPAQIKLMATEVPVPEVLTLTYRQASLATLVYGQRRETVRVGQSGGTIYPEWPADLGISGGVTLTWEADAQLVVRAVPARFPFAVLAEELKRSGALRGLLVRQQLVEHFHLAPDPVKKVALAALALGLSNPAAYG